MKQPQDGRTQRSRPKPGQTERRAVGRRRFADPLGIEPDNGDDLQGLSEAFAYAHWHVLKASLDTLPLGRRMLETRRLMARAMVAMHDLDSGYSRDQIFYRDWDQMPEAELEDQICVETCRNPRDPNHPLSSDRWLVRTRPAPVFGAVSRGRGLLLEETVATRIDLMARTIHLVRELEKQLANIRDELRTVKSRHTKARLVSKALLADWDNAAAVIGPDPSRDSAIGSGLPSHTFTTAWAERVAYYLKESQSAGPRWSNGELAGLFGVLGLDSLSDTDAVRTLVNNFRRREARAGSLANPDASMQEVPAGFLSVALRWLQELKRQAYQRRMTGMDPV